MCHPNTDASLCPECLEAQKRSGIDVKRLLWQLTQFKYEYYPQSQELSDKEIKYLCLSLSRYSKGEIAYYFYKHKIPTMQELAACKDIERQIKNLNSEMSNRIHKYIKRLMNLTNENQRMPPWKNITEFLEKSGYKIAQTCTSTRQVNLMLVESDISADELQSFLKNRGYHSKISRVIEH
ncbi:hypothetical protein [Nostoc sp. TCL26-01]|uniref:hypothetical protein n=1 Tax=Nostoc sp. TCL26-01 TaxID=2576904 RepID=UPI0015BC24A9|nr:hypothetical protein [Nostoc sp. TCL26-01]QLE54947.1 hypothetical protein FD725_05115 [Nostoc sp. TCL26-01]